MQADHERVADQALYGVTVIHYSAINRRTGSSWAACSSELVAIPLVLLVPVRPHPAGWVGQYCRGVGRVLFHFRLYQTVERFNCMLLRFMSFQRLYRRRCRCVRAKRVSAHVKTVPGQ